MKSSSRLVKQFGFQKNRYRGLEKNASQVNLLVGLANMYILRRQLMAA
jgi:IS5 family transposase